MHDNELSRGDAMAEAIERAIVAREFEGRLPPERVLAARFRVSRGTVREAIGKLVARGLLSRRQGAGTFILDDTDRRTAEIWSDMVERHPRLQESLIEFRTMMECRSAELAATRHTAADRRRLQQVARDVDAAYGASDRRAQIEADVAYHRAIADAAHNPVFSYLMGSLLNLLHDHVQLSIAGLQPDTEPSRQLRAQHQALIDAILSRDAAAAGRAAGRHMDYVRVQLNDLRSAA